MSTITIPKTFKQLDDLVAIPRADYDAFMEFRSVKEFIPTKQDKLALAEARKNSKFGRTITYEQLERKLGW